MSKTTLNTSASAYGAYSNIVHAITTMYDVEDFEPFAATPFDPYRINSKGHLHATRPVAWDMNPDHYHNYFVLSHHPDDVRGYAVDSFVLYDGDIKAVVAPWNEDYFKNHIVLQTPIGSRQQFLFEILEQYDTAQRYTNRSLRAMQAVALAKFGKAPNDATHDGLWLPDVEELLLDPDIQLEIFAISESVTSLLDVSLVDMSKATRKRWLNDLWDIIHAQTPRLADQVPGQVEYEQVIGMGLLAALPDAAVFKKWVRIIPGSPRTAIGRIAYIISE